jgi:hypothetical protein
MWLSKLYQDLLRGERSGRHARKPGSRRLPKRPSSGRVWCRPALEWLEDRLAPSVDFTQFASSIQSQLGQVQKTISDILDAGVHLPFINNQLASQIQAVQQLNNDIGTLNSNIGKLANNQNVQASDVQTAVYSALQDLLGDQNNDGKITSDDVFVTPSSGPISDSVQIQVLLHQQAKLATVPLTMDLGLPSLPIQFTSQGNLDISAGFDYELKFGFDSNNNFSFDTSAKIPGQSHQLAVTADITLDKGFQANASLGFFGAVVTDVGTNQGQQSGSPPQAGATELYVTVSVDGLGGVGTPTIDVSGGADAKLQFAAYMGSAPPNELFDISTDFQLDWKFDTHDANGSPPTVSFGDVTIGLGPLFGKILAPIVQDIQLFTNPIQPYIGLIKTPLPVLSDLNHLVGGGDVTLESLAQFAANSSGDPELEAIMDAATLLIDLTNDINSVDVQGDNLSIDFGSFGLGSQNLETWVNGGAPAAIVPGSQQDTGFGTNLTSLVPNVLKDFNLDSFFAQNQNNQFAMAAKDFVDRLNSGVSFSFPVLNSPVSGIFSLILGQDVPLFEMTGNFHFKSAEDQQYPLFGPLSVGFQSALNVDLHVDMGYNTLGVREFLKDGDPASLLDGFFISNDTELKLSGFIGAVASLSGAVFSVSVQGGITIPGGNPLDIKMHNPGNYTDIPFTKLDLNDIFDASGELDAGLDAKVQVGVNILGNFVGWQQDFPIATVKLLDFGNLTKIGKNGAPGTDASIATQDPNTGIVTLSIGAQHIGDLKGFTAPADGSATYIIKSANDPNDASAIDISSFGFTQTFHNVTEIDGFGDFSNPNLTGSDIITVQKDVQDPVEFVGNTYGQHNHITYLGNDPNRFLVNKPGVKAILQAGDFNDVVTAGNSDDVQEYSNQGNNVLVLGGGNNDKITVFGSGTPDLIAGGGMNQTLDATNASGTVVFQAGAGTTTMKGGTGTNIFNWQEGDGGVTLLGQGANNTLQADLATAGGTFSVGPGQSSPLEVDVQAQNQNTPTAIQASDVQTVNVDDLGDKASYQIKNLTNTGVQQVFANLHEDASPGGNADQVRVEGDSQLQNQVTISADANVPAGNYNSQGQPIPQVTGDVTNVDLKILGAASGLGQTVAHYQVITAIPKSSDTLSVDTGSADDQVYVESTQANGTVNVNTGSGDDSIIVGANDHVLDYFKGPLNVDAGPGHNHITFDESQSYVNDVVTLTSNRLIRYTQPPSVTFQSGPTAPPETETAYPLILNYQASGGGDFANGVVFNTSYGGTTLYVPETGANAPTSITADGAYQGVNDAIYVGYDGAFPQGQSQATVNFVLVLPEFPTTAAGSTLDLLRSTLTVLGNGPTYLEGDDEATPNGQSYTVGVQGPFGSLQRTGVSPILYQQLNLTLNTDNQQNQILVPAVAAGTTATINTGTGTNSINVGTPTLDLIQGALTVNAGPGTNNLVSDDGANNMPYAYSLTATTLQRTGQIGIALITFSKMSTLDLYEPSPMNNTTSVSGTAHGTAVTVHTGDGQDNLTVSMLDQFLGGTLDFVWNSGAKKLIVQDTSASGADTYALSPHELDRTGVAPIEFGTLSQVQVFLPLVPATILDIAAILLGTTANVVAGGGATSVVVASGGLDLGNIAGSLAIQGGGLTSVMLEDQNAASSRAYTLADTVNGGNLQAANIGTISWANLAANITLDAGSHGNQINVTSTAGSDHVTVDAGTNDKIQVTGPGTNLGSILGRLDLVGVGANDQAMLLDTGGFAGSQYVLKATELDNLAYLVSPIFPFIAPIGFQNLATLTLLGSPGTSSRPNSYQVQALPASTQVIFIGTGVGSRIIGPNTNNTWLIGPQGNTLNTTLTFANIPNVIGGSGGDTLDLSQNGNPVTTTLNRDGSVDGVDGSVPGILDTFDNMDTLVGDTGATIDGSNYQGSFTQKLTVRKYDSFTLNVANGDFNGTLDASLEGMQTNPIAAISVGGSMNNGALIKVNFLDTFTVGATMDGILKGFGLVNGQVDDVDPTINTITIMDTFGADGQIIAPILSNVTIGQSDLGSIQETEPKQDMKQLQVNGSLGTTGMVQAGSIADCEIGQDLAGQIKVTGPLAILHVGHNFSGSASADSIGSASVGGDFTGTLVVNSMGSFTVAGLNTGQISASPTIAMAPSAGGTVGISVSATAAVSGGFKPGGSVTFALFGPSDPNCTGNSVFTDTEPLLSLTSGLMAASKSYMTTAVGTYHWIATYNGDADNKPVSGAPAPVTTIPGFSISGSVYDDLTENGFTADDPKLGSADANYVPVTVNLYQKGGASPEATTSTDASGNYSFTQLAPGSYTVQEVVPTGWKETANRGAATSDPSGMATVTAVSGGSSTGNDFNNFKYGQISGTAFHDLTGDGFSADDPGLGSMAKAVALSLFKNGGTTPFATAMQDTSGVYRFTGLDYGTYSVQEVVPASWVKTASRGAAVTGTVTAASGLNSTGNDFDNAHIGAQGNPRGKGYWTNNGNASITAGDITVLNTLNLRDMNGKIVTFWATSIATARTQVADFLSGASSTNPANMLSAQLVAMELNVLHGGVSASSVIYDLALAAYTSALNSPAVGGTGALYNGGYITIGNLISAAKNELGLYGNPSKTVTQNGILVYDFENELQNALNNANNNQNFVI